MTDLVKMFCAATGASVVERVDLPPRPARFEPVPASFTTPALQPWFGGISGTQAGLWRHQALALQWISEGRNVIIATATASGKSLAFQAPLVKELLEGDGTAIVFYGTKALGGDQSERWENTLDLAGLPRSLVGEINGDVDMAERDRILAEARIIAATPDASHAWLMRQLACPAGRSFFKRLRYIVIDEAHMFEGSFGSSAAFFFRRLEAAKRRASPDGGCLQFIATTATIAKPAEYLRDLTGREFSVVDEAENGAPSAGLTLLHVDGADSGAAGERTMTELITQLRGTVDPEALIAFMDTRQGVERVCQAVNSSDVLPYRSGFELNDRRPILAQVNAGKLRAIVATSALEVGVDVPQFLLGLNMGVPHTRKSLRQRVGRVGRASRGLFVVVAPPAAFSQLGMTMAEFYAGEPELSHLYLENRFIQFQHARCLVDEIARVDGDTSLPVSVDWPVGFDQMFASAQPGAVRPRDLDTLAVLGVDNPQIAYPLRQINEVSYAIKVARGSADKVGTIDLAKAMREAYPGATYLHNKRSYRVVEWRTRSYEHLILVEPAPGGRTRPMLRSSVNFSFAHDGIIDGRLLTSAAGSLAEAMVGVHESVEGYTLGSTSFPYRDLSKKDPRLSRKQRELTTTGVVIRIAAPWFQGSGEPQVAARKAVARALETILSRTESIAPSDIRSVYANTALLDAGGPRKVDDAIVIFDAAHGGLRLSAPLFDRLDQYLEQLARGAQLAGVEALIDAETVDRLVVWRRSIADARFATGPTPTALGDELVVFAPDSEVTLSYRGSLLHRRLIEPQLVSLDDEERLMYRYEAEPGVLALVAHDRCQPFGQNWRRLLWNPFSNDFRELDA